MTSPGVKKDVAAKQAALAAQAALPGRPRLADESARSSPADTEPTDGELVQRCQDGELTAFEQLLARYQDRIFNLAFRLTGHHDDAQDITQDVFLRALEHIGSFRQQAQVYTWLFRIAVNLAISRRRRQQRLRFVPLDGSARGHNDDGELPTADPVNPRAEPPDAMVQQDERTRLVAQAVAELDEQFRSVLLLKDVEGFGYQQIAEILELPLGTVKSRLHRARSELRVQLRPMFQM